MPPDERIQQLCAQLLRTHNHEVIQLVADELKTAIDTYVAGVQHKYPAVEIGAS